MSTAFSKLEAFQLNAVPNGMDLLQRVEQIERVLLRLVAQIAALERQGSSAPLPAKHDHVDAGSGSNPEASRDSQDSLPNSAASTDDQEPVPSSNAPLPPTPVELAPEVWRKGLVTNQLVARLQTNPTTLKKYLRDLRQVQWAVHRDPDGLGWVYDSPLQCYYPLRVESTEDVFPQGLPAPLVDAESQPEPSPRHDVALQDKLDAIEFDDLMGQGGLYQSDLARLTGIPVNTLQRWKQLLDCAERIRGRTEGRYCYGYARQTKRFYPLNRPIDPAFGVVIATEI